MRRPAEYVWAVAEMAPVVPRTPGAQAAIEAEVTRFIHGLRWRRGLIAGPALAAMLTAQLAQAEMPTYDVAAWTQRAKLWYDTEVSNLIRDNAAAARFIQNAFVAYKSYKMLNSIAQRVRYGNIDFLVEMALPKLDFTTSAFKNGDINTGVIEDTRTQISFTPTNSQTQDNIGWLMRFGGPKVASILQRQPVTLSNISRKLAETVKSALLNPDGDVTITSLDLDSGTPLNVRSPEVWVQLATADATAAWIFSQNRYGLGPSSYDPQAVAVAIQNKAKVERSAETEAAYQAILDAQRAAAQSGQNLYSDPEYQAAVEAYYRLAAQDNAAGKSNLVAAQDAQARLRIIEENAAAEQEVIAGMKLAVLAQQNRTAATNANLQEIGNKYKSKAVPNDVSLTDFLANNPGESMAAQMGVLLKMLQVQQASSQTQSEMLKILAQMQAKLAIKEVQDLAAKKAQEIKEAMAVSPKMAANLAAAARQKAEVAAAAAIPALAGVQNVIYVPGQLTPDGSTSPGKAIRFQAGSDPTNEVNKARRENLTSIRKGLSDQVDSFRKQLSSDLVGGATGGQGFLSQTLFAFTGAFRLACGGDFNLQQEADAWKAAGAQLNLGQEAPASASGTVVDTGLTKDESAPLNSRVYLDSIDPMIQKSLAYGESGGSGPSTPPVPPQLPSPPAPSVPTPPIPARQDAASN